MSVSVEHKEAPFQSQTQHKLEDIMVVQDLKMHFPVTAGLLKRQVGAVMNQTIMPKIQIKFLHCRIDICF